VQAYALAEVVANSAPLLVAEVDAKEAQSLAADLLKALRDALLDTMVLAASAENQVAATEAAPAKLILDKTKLREIIEITMSVARRCLRHDVLAAQDALPNKEDAQWMAALNALAASDNFKSPIITRLCTTLASISSKPNNANKRKPEPKEEDDEDL
ncbi:hypothetical protein GGF41_008577, partial [Coemansia sp. RSA 2531]